MTDEMKQVMAKLHDINTGMCVYCSAAQGVACAKDDCHNVRRPEIDLLRAKVRNLEGQVSRMVEPKNPKWVYFAMDEEMQEQAKKWLEEHKKTCRHWQPNAYHGAIGGVLSYHFCGTSIGMLCSINCACGAKSDCSGDL